MYIVYRGSVSFVLTARAEGELLENDQVLIMMRLSLCMIWLCVFQHVTIANPLNPLHIRIPQSSQEEKEVRVSKEVRTMRQYEESLMTFYTVFSRLPFK